MSHPAQCNECLEFLGNKLWAIVRNDPRPNPRVFFSGPLNDDLHILLGHSLPDFPVNDTQCNGFRGGPKNVGAWLSLTWYKSGVNPTQETNPWIHLLKH